MRADGTLVATAQPCKLSWSADRSMFGGYVKPVRLRTHVRHLRDSKHTLLKDRPEGGRVEGLYGGKLLSSHKALIFQLPGAGGVLAAAAGTQRGSVRRDQQGQNCGKNVGRLHGDLQDTWLVCGSLVWLPRRRRPVGFRVYLQQDIIPQGPGIIRGNDDRDGE